MATAAPKATASSKAPRDSFAAVAFVCDSDPQRPVFSREIDFDGSIVDQAREIIVKVVGREPTRAKPVVVGSSWQVRHNV